MLLPRNAIGLCLSVAVIILNVMLHKDGNEVLPHILRLNNTKKDDACVKAIALMGMEFCPDIAMIPTGQNNAF